MKMNGKLLTMITAVLVLVTLAGCSKKKDDTQSAEVAALAAELKEMKAQLEAAQGTNATLEEIAKMEAAIAELAQQKQQAEQKQEASTPASSARDFLFEQNFARSNITEIVADDGFGGSYKYLPNVGFSAGKRVIYNGTVLLLDYNMPDSALAVLNKEELRLLRNTVYAKHGMIFQSKDLTKHFQPFSWYNPKSSNVEALLTDVDKANISAIQAFENAKPNLKVTKKDLVRDNEYTEWFPVPSWSPELKINEDNTIKNSRWDNEDNWKGTYRIENGFLVVYVTEQRVSDYYSKISNWQWPNGVTYSNDKITNDDGTYYESKITYREPVKMIFPISDIIYLSGEYSNVSYRRIGTTTWF